MFKKASIAAIKSIKNQICLGKITNDWNTAFIPSTDGLVANFKSLLYLGLSVKIALILNVLIFIRMLKIWVD